MTILRRAGLCVLLSFLITHIAIAGGRKKEGQSGMQFLKIGVGARAAGMGEAASSVMDDLSAVFWNPGALALSGASGFRVDQTEWIVGIKHYALAGALDLGGPGVVGISLVAMDYPTMQRTAVDREGATEAGYLSLGEFDVGEFALGLAYSRRITNKLSVGVHARYVSQALGENAIVNERTGQSVDVDNKVTGLSFDFGTVYYTGFRSLRFAIVVQHFSRDFKYQDEAFALPMTYKMGLALDVMDFVDGGEDHTLTLAVDALHPRDFYERIHTGVEYWFRGIFALRGGYKFVYDEESVAGGLGFRYNIAGTTARLDYAYTEFGDHLGSVNRFSFEILF